MSREYKFHRDTNNLLFVEVRGADGACIQRLDLEDEEWERLVEHLRRSLEPPSARDKFEAMARAQLIDLLVDWETRIGETMPSDYKDWHQNCLTEHPLIAALSLKNLRVRLDETERLLDAAEQKHAP